MHASSLSEGIANRDVESEAHEFAANLLMPERRVKGFIHSHASVAEIIEAKRYFKVSAMAMARRAHELGRLSDWEYRQTCSTLTARGYRSAELNGIARERSKVFSFVAQTNRSKGISPRTISEEIGLTVQELHDLSFGNILTVSGGNAPTDKRTTTTRPQLTLRVNHQFET